VPNLFMKRATARNHHRKLFSRLSRLAPDDTVTRLDTHTNVSGVCGHQHLPGIGRNRKRSPSNLVLLLIPVGVDVVVTGVVLGQVVSSAPQIRQARMAQTGEGCGVHAHPTPLPNREGWSSTTSLAKPCALPQRARTCSGDSQDGMRSSKSTARKSGSYPGPGASKAQHYRGL
jgi:hypothetical protein